jgi:hypothetical protein
MTKWLSLLPEARDYASTVRYRPRSLAGAVVVLRRMSLGRRIELGRAVRELVGRLEFQQAGQTVADKIDAAVAAAEIDAVYLRWGVAAVEGLNIDGRPANADDLIAAAPEDLVDEIVARIKHECGLSEQERKN